MMKDEALLFIQYDSDVNNPTRFCFHTAFDDPTVDPALPQRESVEVCTLVFQDLFFPSEPESVPIYKNSVTVIIV